MTTGAPSPDGIVLCEWYDGKIFQTRQFHQSSLDPFPKTLPDLPVVPKPKAQTKFKTGDKVRSTAGSPDMILGIVPPDATLNDQVECYWTQPGKEATDKEPATPEIKRGVLFFLRQLALMSPSQPATPEPSSD